MLSSWELNFRAKQERLWGVTDNGLGLPGGASTTVLVLSRKLRSHPARSGEPWEMGASGMVEVDMSTPV